VAICFGRYGSKNFIIGGGATMKRQLKISYVLLLTFLFSVKCGLFSDQPAEETRNIYKEIIEDPNNHYVLTDSTVNFLDTLPIVSLNVGDKQYVYQYFSSWVGGLEADYSGYYSTYIIKSIDDSMKTINDWYAYDRYTYPIQMDDGSFTFRGEDTAQYSAYSYATIIINTRYGSLKSYSIETASSGMNGHSADIVYLSINDTSIPTGKLLNEFYAKEKLLKPEEKWIN
jgi:hypothetical protein